MDKILVRLLVPAVQESFDLFVPQDLEISVLTRLMSDGLETICKDRFISPENPFLLQKDPDILFDPSYTLMDYGVKDGVQLVLL